MQYHSYWGMVVKLGCECTVHIMFGLSVLYTKLDKFPYMMVVAITISPGPSIDTNICLGKTHRRQKTNLFVSFEFFYDSSKRKDLWLF